MRCSQVSCVDMILYLGVSLNGGTPISHPKMIVFSRKTHGCWVPPFWETLIWCWTVSLRTMIWSKSINVEVFFTYIAAWDTSYILYTWWCRTFLDLSNINRTCGLMVAKQASYLEMRCISCYGSSFLPRYLHDLCGSCCIFLTTCFHVSEARSVLHCWNITFQDIRNRKWCLLPFFGNNDIWSYNR